MVKFFKAILDAILFIWQLPQNLCGIFMLLYHKKTNSEIRKYTRYGVTYYAAKHVNNCGVSLGNFIFFDSDRSHGDRFSVLHEHGHQIQSLILGPFYLIIIGIPSGIHNLFSCVTRCNYYHFYTEAWANALAGLN